MTPTAIRTVRTGRLLHITIDRPGRMNALGVDDLVALDTAISGAEATGARAIVLTGAGRAFCTGADLTAVTGEEPEVVMDAANRVIRGIVSAPIPVIAAVNGPAVGYGVALACAADLTYAAESAYFLLSFTSIGLMPDGGATALVAAAIGRARATELALLGQRLSATDAAQTGLVARILPDDQLAAHVEAVAGTLGAGPRRALELTRRALAASTLGHLDHALERERAGQIELIGTPDFAEGADAVLTKRPPHLLSRPPADHRRIMATLGGQLTLNARRHPDRPALIFEGVERSYGQLDREINQYANALLSLGVQKGDRVAVLSPNSDRFLLALYGAFKVGAIVSPFNPRSTARELAYLLEDSGASVLLFGGDTVAAVRDLAKLEQAPAAPALSLDGADGFDDFVQLASSMPDSDPQVEVREDDDCMIIYTSGTTGKPKGALFDHHRLLWVGHAVSSLGVNSFDRNLHVAPMYHCAELVLFVLSGFSMGTTHVVLPAFEPAAVLDALERYRITVFLGVPTMYQMMLTVPDLERRDLSHWRLGFFGAAPMPPTAVAKLVTTFPDVGFFQLCGPTESGPTGIYSTPDEVAVRPDATGRWPITNAEFRLVDPDGNDVPTGMTGEIILRGETIMKGYWNKPEATAETIRDGWLHTGDLAVRDADGFITIVDRLKDMIITGGRNVYSIEVENALAGHPDVQDVAVVGLDHATFGETIVAIVTPVPGREVTLEELRTYAAEYVADYKLPRDLIVRDIPRNPSGKILKHVLRSEIRDDSAQRT